MDFADLVNKFTDLGLALIPLLGVVAFLVFIIGVGRFIRSTDNEAELKKSKQTLIWGVIGLFVLFSIWGIVAFIRGEFGLSTSFGIPQLRINGERELVPDVHSRIIEE